jgi:hypothetical protein
MKTKSRSYDYRRLRINFTYDIDFWARHWGISASSISEAIIKTGSNVLSMIRKYLKASSKLQS